jgi:hypothetical protein
MRTNRVEMGSPDINPLHGSSRNSVEGNESRPGKTYARVMGQIK